MLGQAFWEASGEPHVQLHVDNQVGGNILFEVELRGIQ